MYLKYSYNIIIHIFDHNLTQNNEKNGKLCIFAKTTKEIK